MQEVPGSALPGRVTRRTARMARLAADILCGEPFYDDLQKLHDDVRYLRVMYGAS